MQDVEDGGNGRAEKPLTGIKPFVRDTRNLLLVRPIGQEAAEELFLKTLAYALRRTIQQTHQVEQLEIAVELIGRP